MDLFQSTWTIKCLFTHGARVDSFATSRCGFERGRRVLVLWGRWGSQGRDSHGGGDDLLFEGGYGWIHEPYMRRAGRLRYVGIGEIVARGCEQWRPLILRMPGRVCGNIAQYKPAEWGGELVTTQLVG